MSSTSNIQAPKTSYLGNMPQRIVRYCLSARRVTERLKPPYSADDILLWIQKTTNVLRSMLPQTLIPRLAQQEHDDLCRHTGHMGIREWVIDIIIWSCFSDSCHNLVVKSLIKSGRSDADVNTITSSVTNYAICVTTVVQGLCSIIKKSSFTNVVDQHIADMQPLRLQAYFLAKSLHNCNEFVFKGGVLEQTLGPFTKHIKSCKPQTSVSAILDYCDIVKFWNTTLSSRVPDQVQDQNTPTHKQYETTKALVFPATKPQKILTSRVPDQSETNSDVDKELVSRLAKNIKKSTNMLSLFTEDAPESKRKRLNDSIIKQEEEDVDDDGGTATSPQLVDAASARLIKITSDQIQLMK